ncbi:hypothetical protein [Streptomyces sp. CBMA156]|uniref:hypothetical protein n=1 Tax=Streptomyces sp. CBMA156 TaxID=1930280 RepID=UPI001CB82F4C|nr:hypothetical protein [Streptomyces sp. CBMA156]
MSVHVGADLPDPGVAGVLRGRRGTGGLFGDEGGHQVGWPPTPVSPAAPPPRQRRKILSVATTLAGAAPGAVLVLHGQTAWALVAGAVLAGGTLLLYRE